MLSLRKVGSAPWVQSCCGVFAAEYLRLVWNTNRFVIDPADIYDRWRLDLPAIVAMWHGQHFMMPFVKRAEHRVKALISRHRDGAINAIAAERLGIENIRGSGTHGRDVHRKGGAVAFKAMLDALEEGYVVALTADVPKVARIAGRGIVQLASISGRPIYPIAVATSRRFELDNWDRSVVNLPFGRGAIAFGAPIHVAGDAAEEALEAARQAVESGLNATTERAYAIADKS